MAGWRGDAQTIRTLLPYLWPRGRWDLRRRVILALVLLVGAKVAVVQAPLLLGAVVDALETDPLLGVVAVPAGLIAAFGLARLAGVAFGEAAGRRVRPRRTAGGARGRAAGVPASPWSVARLSPEPPHGGLEPHHRTRDQGDRIPPFLRALQHFADAPGDRLRHRDSALRYEVSFALIVLVSVVVYIVFTFLITEWRIRFVRRMNESDEQANTKAIDSLLNYETVKYFGNEEHEARRFDVSLRRYQSAAVTTKVSLALLNAGQAFLTAAGMTAVLLLAASGVAEGSMGIGDLVAVNAFMLQLFHPLGFLGFVYRQIRQSLVDMERMFDLLGERREIADAPGAPALVVGTGLLEFDGVNFAYDPRRPILRDIHFTVAPGRTVAIVGPSGAGKSTLSRLLFRFYDVSSGAIRIDGQDIRGVAQASVRDAIGIVPQDTVLFNDTIRYNLAYARPGCGEAEIDHAVRMARLDGFIASLPEGYESMVGERGLKLSGGEKQRVAIARMLLKEPRLMVFDEATSALDTATEKEIQAELAEVSRGHTTLIAAHRLSTVVDADEILVLDSGRIVERGDHAALLAAGGIYAGMWRRQQESVLMAKRLAALGDNGAAARPAAE